MSPTAKKKSTEKKVVTKKAAAPKKAPALKTAEKKHKEVVKHVEKKVAPMKKEAPTSAKAHANPTPKSSSSSTPKSVEPAQAQVAQKLKGIRIRLSAFDHTVLDEAALKIIDTAMRSGAVVHGPTPLPTKIRKFTVNRSTFVHKDARDQFEMRIHRRLIDLTDTTFKTVDALQNLSLPSGVDIEIRMG